MLRIQRKRVVVLGAAACVGASDLAGPRRGRQARRNGPSIVAIAAATMLAASSCRNNPGSGSESSARIASALTVGSTASASQILAALEAQPGSPVQAAVAQGFASVAGGVLPQFSTSASAAESKPATVVLPQLSTAAVHLADVTSGASVEFSLNGALPVVAQTVGGYVVYPGAFGVGGTVLHRALPGGSEDFISLPTRPATPEVDYSIALGAGIAGLRLVGATLEMVDSAGVPRLRVAPPYIVGADGTSTDGTLALTGCAFDSDPSPPWGRLVTGPGAATCTVRVTWPDASVVYPAILDPRWTTTGSMGTARFEHTLVLLSTGKALAAGGRSTTSGTTGLTSAELYDPSTGTWSATGSLAHGRRLHTATQLPTSSNPTTSGKVLVAGGISGSSSMNTAELYSPSAGTWTAAANMDVVRHAHTATLLTDGRVLVAGGMNGTTTIATASLYNPASGTGSWVATTGPIPPAGLKNHTANLIQTTNTQLNNHVLLVGGNNGSGTIASVYLFDPVQNAFSTLASIPSPREQATAVTLTNSNGKILVAGGKNGSSVLATAIVFDPSFSNGSWSSAGTMNSPRVGHSMTLLPSSIVANGQLLVAGGSSTGSDTLASAELFSGTSTWTVTPSMPGPLQGHQAVLLGGNMVLVAGGLSSTSNVTTAAYLYDASFGLSCTSNGQCATGNCVSGVCCDTTCTGTCGACNLAGHLGTCTALSSGTVCRASAGACDVAETCNGSVLTCPADGFAASGTVCRAAAGECDVAETCSGTSAACPSDAKKSSGTACTDDGNPCTKDQCDGTDVTCQHPAGNAGTVCRAANGACDVAETCTGTSTTCPADGFAASGTVCRASAGVCDVAETCTGSSAACPADGFLPASTICRPSTGQCDVAESCTGSSAACPADGFAANGTTCNDGNACTQTDTCQSGSCVGGNPVTCVALDQCHVAGTCNSSTGACSNPAKANGTTCSDGNACTQTDTCQSGTCTGGNPVTCTAQDQCHGVGTCNTSTGACSNPALANGAACNDGNACTQTDTCQSGTCTGGNPVTCVASDQCHGVGTCNTSTGVCSNPALANGTACNDGNACTTGESCQAGTCGSGNAVTCTADQCHTVGSCAPSSGCPAPVAKSDGTACNDNNACTQTDTCIAGGCTGSNPVTCQAADQCHTGGACNPSTGACSNVNIADGTPCNDGNACTNGETCQGGTCEGGEPIACVAQDECHSAGFCDSTSGTCANQVPQPDGTPCSGGICMSAVCQEVSAASAVPTPIDPTVPVDIQQSTSFLYTGPNAIQIGVPAGTIARESAGVLRGRVLGTAGNPILGATAVVVGHPEFGATVSGADGAYSLAVNGGGQLRIEVQASGYMPVQRTLFVRPLDYSNPPDVVMTQLDPASTVVNLLSPAVQIAHATPVVDQRGSRQSVLAFFPGTQATAETNDGSSVPLNTLTIHATELTVGATGPKAMPGLLPPGSGYTYAADLRADEASGGNITGLKFSQPVVNYVDNFLNFPVGTAVPVGHYDMAAGSWVGDPDGCVIQVLGTSNGMAQIDSDGDGLPDGVDRLAILGVTAQEQASLAGLYAQGTTLWRVQLTHFTEVDYNWPIATPPGDTPPAPPNGDLAPDPNNNQSPDTCDTSGTIVDCNNQILGERIPIVGTPFSLMYSSARAPGYGTGSASVTIPLTGPTPPQGLQRVDLYVSVAGQDSVQFFPGSPNQTTTFTWDGLDAFGRPVIGNADADVKLYYVYDTFYGYAFLPKAQSSFALYPNLNAPGVAPVQPAEVQYSLAYSQTVRLTNPNVAAQGGLGGWELDVHNMYDPRTFTLTRGNGQQIPALPITLTPFSSNLGLFGDDLYPAPDGSLYLSQEFAAEPGIVRVDPSGMSVSEVATNISPLYLASKGDVLYFTDQFVPGTDMLGAGIVGKVNPDGTTTTVAGSFPPVCPGQNTGDEGPATDACLGNIFSMAIAPDGQVFIISNPFQAPQQPAQPPELRRIDAAGIIHNALNPAVAAQTTPEVVAVAIAPDYSIYLVTVTTGPHYQVTRLMNDGTLLQVAGQASGTEACSDTDGSNGIRVGTCRGLFPTFGPDGALYLLSNITFQTPLFPGSTITRGSIVRLQPDGRLAEVFPGLKSVNVQEFKVAPNGDIVAEVSTPATNPALPSEYWSGSVGGIYHLRPSLPSISEAGYVVPSQDGSEVYTFDTNGRHVTTSDGLTAATKYQFQYDSNGYVSAITDRNGLTTSIMRDAAGNLAAITSPTGQQTSLGLDDNGYLASITTPGGAQSQFQYSIGLMTSEIDTRGGTHQFTYDTNGKLTQDLNPIDGGWTLSNVQSGGSNTVTMTSGEGRVSVYGSTADLGSQSVGGAELQGNRTRSVTEPSGLSTTSRIDSQNDRVVTATDGTVTQTTRAADLRFGMAAAYVSSRIVTTPGGLTNTASMVRSATVEGDGVTLMSQTDVTTINGQTQTMTYDGNSRTTTIVSPLGRQRTITEDDHGRTVFSQEGTLAGATYGYDSRGRLTSVTIGTGPTASTVTASYNNHDLPNMTTDPSLANTNYGYDDDNRLDSQVAPDGAITSLHLSQAGDLMSISPPGEGAHGFTYTPIGDELSYTPPAISDGTPSTTRSYNSDRQLTGITRPDGKTITFGYDTAGRSSTTVYDAGTVTWSYSPSTGRVTDILATDGGLAHMTYDGALLIDTQWSGIVAGSVGRTWNNDFRVATESVNGSNVVAYGYDPDGMLTAAGAMTISRDPGTGAISGTTLGGVADTRSYNQFGLRTDYAASFEGNPLLHIVDTPDQSGRTSERTETVDGVAHVYDYGFDANGRLQTVTSDGVLLRTYGNDANGNRLSVTGSGPGVSGTYDVQDRLLTYAQYAYTYTANGELRTKTDTTTGQVTDYSYDALGNLRAVTLPDGRFIEYVLDGKNRRIGKKINGQLVQGWLYRNNLRPIAELDGNNSVVSEFVYASGRDVPAYMIKGGATFRIVSDDVGTPRRIVDVSTGTIAEAKDVDEFGVIVSESNPTFQPFGFAGGVTDPDTGLVRFGARDYDPTVGRWTTKDPLRFDGGTNFYTYAGNDPIDFVDYSGLDVQIGIRPFYPRPVPYAKHCLVRFNGSNSDTLSYDLNGVHADPSPGTADFYNTSGIGFGPDWGFSNDQCVRDQMNSCNQDSYNLFTFNCCMCVSNALHACGLQPMTGFVWPNSPSDASNPPYTDTIWNMITTFLDWM
jgi:RHS repeat-associated protein